RRSALLDKLAEATLVAQCTFELSLVTRQLAFGLADLGLDGTAIHREKQFPLLHGRAIAKMDFGDLTIDASLDRHARHRRDRAKQLDANGNSLLGCGRDLDRHHPWSILLVRRLRHSALKRPIAIRHRTVRRQGQCRGHPQPKSPFVHCLLEPGLITGASLCSSASSINFFLCSFFLILAHPKTPCTFPLIFP